MVPQMAAVKVAVQNCGLSKVPRQIQPGMPAVQLDDSQT